MAPPWRCRLCRGRVWLGGFHAFEQGGQPAAVMCDPLPQRSVEPGGKRFEACASAGMVRCAGINPAGINHLEMRHRSQLPFQPHQRFGDQRKVEPRGPILLACTCRAVCHNRGGGGQSAIREITIIAICPPPLILLFGSFTAWPKVRKGLRHVGRVFQDDATRGHNIVI